jgi:hypothetical protein
MESSSATSQFDVPLMELMLFTNDVELARAAYIAEVGRVVVDLERRGKSDRQHGYHLELNDHNIDDITRIKKAVPIKIMCRLNPIYRGSVDEIEGALSAGADVLMLPMFRTPKEVEMFVEMTGNRAKTSLLFETKEAVGCISEFRDFDVDEVYVGLNDLRLATGVSFQYELLANGVVDRVRSEFPHHDFGFGGLTILDQGRPLGTRDIIGELTRLQANQVIVRRAFKRDIAGLEMGVEVKRLKHFYESCLLRTPAQVAEEHQGFTDKISDILDHV